MHEKAYKSQSEKRSMEGELEDGERWRCRLSVRNKNMHFRNQLLILIHTRCTLFVSTLAPLSQLLWEDTIFPKYGK